MSTDGFRPRQVKGMLRLAVFLVCWPLILVRLAWELFRLHVWQKWRIEKGAGCVVDIQTWIVNGKNVRFGQRVKVSAFSTIIAGNIAQVSIGDFCILGPGVVLAAIDHGMRINGDPFRYQAWDDTKEGSIVIESNVWVGANVVVLSGVTIGANTVIGAGAIVTKSVPANSVVTGTNTLVIKRRMHESAGST